MAKKYPKQYIPKGLSAADKKKQRAELDKSTKAYEEGRYVKRKKIKGFKSKPSGHVAKAKKMYNVDSIKASKELAEATGCSIATLKKIVKKGQGAYYSSGSRPNQTPQSWARARLASAITGGNASKVDYKALSEGCKPSSKALKIAKKPKSAK